MSMISAGGWMLAKDVPLERGYEIDGDLQVIATGFVDRCARRGSSEPQAGTATSLRGCTWRPGQITDKATFNIQEKNRSITLSTASASGGIEAPWSLQITIEPISPQQFSFKFTLKHGATINFSGSWQKDAMPPCVR
jgi:hypothetical protein